MDPPHMTRFE